MKRFDQSILLVCFICAFVFAARLTKKATDGFTMMGIQSHYPYNGAWDVQNPPLPDVFEQRFIYLAAGGQCFAFLSEDGKYVLKFFKHPLKKLNRDYSSYKLAMEKLPEETGLLFVHLNKTGNLNRKAQIVDKLGIEHRVDLDQHDFILQKRAMMTYPHLLHLVEINDLKGAKEAIDSICVLILNRCRKGIHDDDAKIHRNCGFIDNQAVIIDVGRFKVDARRLDPKVQSADLIRCTEKLKGYLEEISPELSLYLEEVRTSTLYNFDE